MRGQSAGEYVLVAVLVLVMVSTVMLGAFKQAEIDLAISSVRLACMEMTASDATLQCRTIGYADTGTEITITPGTTRTLTNSEQTTFTNLALSKMREVFHKGQAPTPGNCFFASFNLYCIEF